MTREKAEKIATPILWEGSTQRIFDDATGALADAGIPYASELRAGPDQIGKVLLAVSLRTLFWRFGLFKGYAEKQKGWRIKVLQSDYSRAKRVVNGLLTESESETT
jgi:hypothetical protein